jgi:DNA helicase HerA-like ATPase
MLKRYKEFDLDYPRGFQGQILTPRENRSPNVLKRLRSGEFLTVDLSEFSSDVQRVKYTCSILQELLNFYKNKPETNELKFLVILEECHHFLREYIKEVPKDAVAILGRCMRELRKRGVGFIIISHKVTDFEGAIRTNAHTKVYFRTGYEQDIKRIGTLYGSGYAKPINILPKGVALVHFPEYNDGKPYFIAFRPLLSSHGYVKR